MSVADMRLVFSRLVNKKGYAWKALRLLALRSAYFFAQQPAIGGQQKPLAQYLEQMISKLAKDMPVCETQSPPGFLCTSITFSRITCKSSFIFPHCRLFMHISCS